MNWAEALSALRAQLDGLAVELVQEVDSTNAELLRRARAGGMLPTLLIAENRAPHTDAWGDRG